MDKESGLGFKTPQNAESGSDEERDQIAESTQTVLMNPKKVTKMSARR